MLTAPLCAAPKAYSDQPQHTPGIRPLAAVHAPPGPGGGAIPAASSSGRSANQSAEADAWPLRQEAMTRALQDLHRNGNPRDAEPEGGPFSSVSSEARRPPSVGGLMLFNR